MKLRCVLAHEIYFCRVVANFDKLCFLVFPLSCFTILHILVFPVPTCGPWVEVISRHEQHPYFELFFSMTLWNITPSIYVFFVTVIELLYVCFLSREIMVLMIDSITPINNKMWECDFFSSLMCIIINIILTVLIIHQLRWLDFTLWQHISHPHWDIPSGSC